MSIATLQGKPILSSTPVTWSLRYGVQPNVGTMDFSPQDAAAILAVGLRPLTLVLENETIEKLYVTQEVPSDVPAIRRLRVVDRRWFWTFRQYQAGYNIRRRFGVKSLEAPNAVGGPRTIVDTVTYAPWSLKGGTTPWTAQDVMADLEPRVSDAETDTTNVQPLTFGKLPDKVKAIRFENLFLTGDIATCMSTVMDYLPGLALYLDEKGNVVFTLQSDGSEAQLIKGAGPEKVDGGHIVPIDLSRIRPIWIEVLFSRECEVRFDFTESDGSTTSSPDARFLENVMPSVDYTYTKPDGTIVTQGTWVNIQEELTSWGPVPLIQAGAARFTKGDLRRACVPWNPVMDAIETVGVSVADVDWVARVTTACQHFRRTYRVNKRWMDRIFQLTAGRVATLDFALGARGQSQIYSDYAYLSSARSLYRDYKQGANKLGLVKNYAIWSGGAISPTQQVAPGSVRVLDPDQGIIQFDFNVDVAGVFATVFPSQIEINGQNTAPGTKVSGNGITGDILDKSAVNCWDILSDPDVYPVFTARYAASTILTAQPAVGGYAASPGGQRDFLQQFHVIKVTPEQVQRPFAGQKNCAGPVLQIKVGANLETARVAWKDEASADIEAVFGLPNGSKVSGNIDALTINLDTNPGGAKGGASLNAIALAVVERMYHSLSDRPVGSATFDLVPGLVPQGWVDSVTFGIATSGEAFASLGAPDRVEPLTLESFFGSSLQALVMRLANQANS